MSLCYCFKIGGRPRLKSKKLCELFIVQLINTFFFEDRRQDSSLYRESCGAHLYSGGLLHLEWIDFITLNRS